MIAIHEDTSPVPFILASLVASYPEETFAENVQALVEDLAATDWDDEELGARFDLLCTQLAGRLSDVEQLNDLRSEYIDLFDRGRQVNSLYETEYGRERAMVKGNELVDIAAFYRAFGLETGGEGVLAEMVDHVSVELEFYALLLLKSEALAETGNQGGLEIVRDAREKFLRSHLGRFVGSIGTRPGVAGSPFYSAAFAFCEALVTAEAKRLGVDLERVEWLSNQSEPVDMTCGGSVGCLK